LERLLHIEEHLRSPCGRCRHYEIIRGPAAVMYPNTALSGIVNKITRKPLPYRQETVTGSVTSYGQVRGEVDATGPLGSIGAGKFSYRFIGMGQHGPTKASRMRTTTASPFTRHYSFDYNNTRSMSRSTTGDHPALESDRGDPAGWNGVHR